MLHNVLIVKRLIVVILALAGSLTLYGFQQVDSHYLNVLDKAEQYYREGDYQNAVSKLKIVIFGLYGEEKLQAKAYVYLSLSYFYLKDRENSEKYLRDAETLMGQQDLLALDITEAARNDLERLIYTIKAGRNPITGFRILPKLPEENLISNTGSDQRQLEQRIKDNPRDPSSFYELYNLFRENYNYPEAKKAIEDLIKNNPRETYAHYILGIILYQEKKFKDAINRFEDFFKFSGNVTVEENIFTEIIAYQILSHYLQGDRNKTEKLLTQYAAFFTLERIRALPLSEKDKNMLRGIINMNRK